MSQFLLPLQPRLVYDPAHFLLHAGIAPLAATVTSKLTGPDFFIGSISGPARSGKSHASVYFAREVERSGYFPRVVSGDRFLETIPELLPAVGADSVTIVDDAQIAMKAFTPDHSGAFVAYVEAMRLARGKLLFLGLENLESLPVDEHVLSRLRAAWFGSIAQPGDQDIEELLKRLAWQRGLKLPPSKTPGLSKRTRRDIAGLEEYLERLAVLSGSLGKPAKGELLYDALE